MRRIEVWADLVCAWAYIGKRRLEAAIADLDEPVEVVWRPFRIDPTAPPQPQPIDELLTDPSIRPALQACNPEVPVERHRETVADLAAGVGLGDSFGARWRVDPQRAHRLVLLAHEHGGAPLQDAVAEAVLAAHFTAGADISDPGVLAELAADAGFDAAAALLDSDAGVERLRFELLRGKAIGVATSPTFVVDGRAIAGAQSPEVLRGFITAAKPARRTQPEEVERLRLAESLLGRRDPLGALELLAPVARDFPEDANVTLLSARCYYASAQLGRARRTLERLVAANPSDFYARELLGRTLRRQGEDAAAATQLRLVAGVRAAD